MVSISAEGAHFPYLTVYRPQKSSAGVVSLLVGVSNSMDEANNASDSERCR